MVRAFVVVVFVACASPTDRVATKTAAPGGAVSVTLTNARAADGSPLTVRIQSGVITHVSRSDVPASDRVRDLGGATLVPAVIDSHVHITYHPVASELRAAGVGAVVDLGAPLASIGTAREIDAIEAGPMITSPAGYPTRSWGHNGYGLEIESPRAAAAAVDTLNAAGAGVVKVALAGPRGLGRDALTAVLDAAHATGRRVVGHALSAEDAAMAARAGVDVLAHTPLEPLDADAAAAWAGRAVITTLAAFSPQPAAANLRRLIAAGATPIYGTDLGNTRVAGISEAEIVAMQDAGMSGAAILESMTTAPSRLWDLPVGRLEVGQKACLLVLDASPHVAPRTLAAPREVIDC